MRRFIYERSATNIRDWSLAYSLVTGHWSLVYCVFNHIIDFEIGMFTEYIFERFYMLRLEQKRMLKILILRFSV